VSGSVSEGPVGWMDVFGHMEDGMGRHGMARHGKGREGQGMNLGPDGDGWRLDRFSLST
jgi:hypothetical protein